MLKKFWKWLTEEKYHPYIVDFICPRCGGKMSGDAKSEFFPVYCEPCDKTYIAGIEAVDEGVTEHTYLTGDYYLGKPKD